MSRPAPRRSRLRRAAASLAVTAALGVLPAATPVATSAAALSGAVPSPAAPSPAVPSSDVGGRPAPAVPAGAPEERPDYRLYRNPDGSPVRFDPCRPLRVRINAPGPDAEADAREALRRIALVTGHEVVVEGPTDFVPTWSARTLPGVELVIAWAVPGTSPGSSDILDGGKLGTGGWSSQGHRVGQEVVWRATAGFAVLDVTRDDLAPGFGPGLTRGALLLHEIAHALGVDHVGDSSQLMYPVLRHRPDPVVLGTGDVEALRRVGAPAGCLSG